MSWDTIFSTLAARWHWDLTDCFESFFVNFKITDCGIVCWPMCMTTFGFLSRQGLQEGQTRPEFLVRVNPWNTAALYRGRAQCHCIRRAAKFVPKWGAFLFNILSGVWFTGENCASVSMCYIVWGACNKLCEESCTRGWFLCRADVLCRNVRSKATCVLSPVLFSPEILTLLVCFPNPNLFSMERALFISWC